MAIEVDTVQTQTSTALNQTQTKPAVEPAFHNANLGQHQARILYLTDFCAVIFRNMLEYLRNFKFIFPFKYSISYKVSYFRLCSSDCTI